MERERLTRERVAILQACITDGVLWNPGPARQLLCDPDAVGETFFDLQEQMLALPTRGKAKLLFDHEILWHRSHRGAKYVRAEGLRPSIGGAVVVGYRHVLNL